MHITTAAFLAHSEPTLPLLLKQTTLSSSYPYLRPKILPASAFVRYQLCTSKAEAAVQLSRLESSSVE